MLKQYTTGCLRNGNISDEIINAFYSEYSSRDKKRIMV